MDTEETERFQCFICLDLIYKPVVLECGHVSCFWCVHKAMSAFRGSRCAICRHSFNFFPGICRVLHNLLLKIEPEAYKRREAETLEEEKSADCFSSQFIENSVDDGKPEISSNLIQTDALRENGMSISDVLCSGCGDLLFRPAVLNCGDVFCEHCLGRLAGDKIKCPTCGDMHPGGLPKVCFDLDHFLEKEFPLEYARRRDSFKPEQSNTQTGGSSSSASQIETLHKQTMIQKKMVQIANGGFLEDEECLNVHLGVGCDACGMYPIFGKRYKCRDCKESVGFDLCEACYDSPSKRPGRFNQQHTPDHRLVLDDSSILINVMRGYYRDGLLLGSISEHGDEVNELDNSP